MESNINFKSIALGGKWEGDRYILINGRKMGLDEKRAEKGKREKGQIYFGSWKMLNKFQ